MFVADPQIPDLPAPAQCSLPIRDPGSTPTSPAVLGEVGE
jgi:hypothetical protein